MLVHSVPDNRIVSVDVLRGFAVLGIYWVNIFIFALPSSAETRAISLHDTDFLNMAIHTFTDTYIEGTMRALFSMLFGASALIFLNENRLTNQGIVVVDRYYRRTLWLIVFGVIHAYLLLWPYDVLYVYGVFGLLLFPLRNLSSKALFALGLLFLLLGDVKFIAPRIDANALSPLKNVDIMQEIEIPAAVSTDTVLDPDTADTTDTAAEGSTAPSPPIQGKPAGAASTNFDLESWYYHGGYWTIFAVQRDIVAEKQSQTLYNEYLFDIGGMMLLGMAFYKCGLLSAQWSRLAYLALLLMGYGFGAWIRYYSAAIMSIDGPSDHWTSAYNIGRLLIAVGHLGLVGLLNTSNGLKRIAAGLARVGRLALTHYIAQTILSIFLFYGFGFGLFAQLQRFQIVVIVVAVWILQILLSYLWLFYFHYGPLEWLWRSLVYGKVQPWIKNRNAGIADVNT